MGFEEVAGCSGRKSAEYERNCTAVQELSNHCWYLVKLFNNSRLQDKSTCILQTTGKILVQRSCCSYKFLPFPNLYHSKTATSISMWSVMWWKVWKCSVREVVL